MKKETPRKISLLGSRATSVLSVSLVLIVIGLCATLGMTVHRASAVLSDDVSLLVTIVPGEDNLKVSELKRMFNDAPWVDSYEYTDGTTVLMRESSAMDSLTRQGLALLSTNPFGDEFVIHLSEGWRSTDSIASLSRQLAVMPSVDIVSGDATAMGQVSSGIGRVMVYLGAFALVLLVISIVLINNTISLSIYSRRFNIHTMKLVGATNSFIRKPYVRAGTATGVIAGVIASLAVCGTQCYLMVNDELVGPWITVTGVVLTAVGLIVIGAFIARAAAWRAATAYLYKSYDSLFKK